MTIKSEPFLVAQNESEILGYARVEINELLNPEISIALKETTLGIGVGSKLITNIEEICRILNFSNLDAFVNNSNTQSMNFFIKHGFNKINSLDSGFINLRKKFE